MGQYDLVGNDLDGNGTVDLSQKRPKSQLPWFYRGKITEMSPGIFPPGTLPLKKRVLPNTRRTVREMYCIA